MLLQCTVSPMSRGPLVGQEREEVAMDTLHDEARTIVEETMEPTRVARWCSMRAQHPASFAGIGRPPLATLWNTARGQRLTANS